MPEMLAPQNYAMWLARTSEPEHLSALTSSPSEVSIRLFPVSKAVGNVKNDSPDLIIPVE